MMPIEALKMNKAQAAAHRYWAVHQTATDGHATASNISEIEFHTSVGGADVCTGGTVISGGGFTGSTPANAFNDNINSSYAPGGTAGYIGYDFGASSVNWKNIVEYTIGMGSGINPTACPKTFSLKWSDDGTNWFSPSGNVGAVQTASLWIINGAVQTFPRVLAAGFHFGWRFMMLTQNGGTSQCRINEIQFRATAGSADQTVNTGATNGPLARTIDTGGDSSSHNAFDNTFDDYCYLQAATNRYVGQMYATPIAVTQIFIDCGSMTTQYTPATGRVDYTDDGDTWVSGPTITFGSWAANTGQVANVSGGSSSPEYTGAISNQSLGAENAGGTAFLSVNVLSTGTITYNSNEVGSTTLETWKTSGAGSDFEIMGTLSGAGAGSATGDTQSTWLALSSSRSWGWTVNANGQANKTLTIQLRRAADDVLIDTATIDIDLLAGTG